MAPTAHLLVHASQVRVLLASAPQLLVLGALGRLHAPDEVFVALSSVVAFVVVRVVRARHLGATAAACEEARLEAAIARVIELGELRLPASAPLSLEPRPVLCELVDRVLDVCSTQS